MDQREEEKNERAWAHILSDLNQWFMIDHCAKENNKVFWWLCLWVKMGKLEMGPIGKTENARAWASSVKHFVFTNKVAGARETQTTTKN